MKNIALNTLAAICALGLSGCTSDGNSFPSLLGSDAQEGIYAKSSNVVNGSYTGTFVGQRVTAFRQELNLISQAQKSNERELEKINTNISNNANLYQKTVSNVETKLQAGTTPGNPNMYAMLQQAQGNVQTMFANANALENLSAKTSDTLTSVTYLENAISAAFSISGAVDEDHKQLRELQNEAMTIAQKAAALNENVSGAANFQQQSAIQASQEIDGLRESVKSGSNTGAVVSRPVIMHRTTKPVVSSQVKPLFSVRFADKNVDYKEGLSTAIKSALNRKPNTVFEIVAVSNSKTKAEAQEHAARIFNEVVSMGANAGSINLNAKVNEKSTVSEVQIFVK